MKLKKKLEIHKKKIYYIRQSLKPDSVTKNPFINEKISMEVGKSLKLTLKNVNFKKICKNFL